MEILLNPHCEKYFPGESATTETSTFHRKLPDYAPTPLRRLPESAEKYGLQNIYLKDESSRLGLPAFKILGASYAIWKVLEERYSLNLDDWSDLSELKNLLAGYPPLTLITATDGNHGRGVARMGKLLGFPVQVLMPKGTVEARLEGIRSEGAEVTVVEGNYDDAVRQAEGLQSDDTILIQDTSRSGKEKINRWIIAGYATMFREIDNQLETSKLPQPEVVFVQIGVGSLAAAAVRHFKAESRNKPAKIIGVEPTKAACALEAVKNGELVSLPGEQNSIMAGLNCGTIASAAGDEIRRGIDCFLTIEDNYALEAMLELADSGIRISESGAAGYAGLKAMMESESAERAKKHLQLDENTNVLLLLTEGITDPEGYKKALER